MSADITALVISVKSEGISEASQKLGGLSTSAANAERRISALTESMKKLNVVNELSAKSAENIVAKLREQDKLLATMSANSRTAARGTQDLAAAMTLLAASLNLMNQNVILAERNQRRHNESMREAHGLARGLTGSFGALWLTYGNLAGMSVGVAIGAGLKSIIGIGKDVENTLEGIRVRAGESKESMNQLAEAVERIGKGVYGPLEVAKAFETLALAGLKAKDSTLAIGAALNLATAGGTTIEKAAESLVTIGTAVGATAKSFDTLADGITAAANSSLASVDSIAESVKRASVVNKLYGASFDDILTQTAALAQLGIKNTAAGTAIVNFYNNSLGQTEKSRKALDALGMSFTDLNGKAKPVVEAFEEFTAKLNKFDLKSQQTIINDIFGERALRDVEGLRDAVNRSADDTTKYSNKLREIQGQIAEAAGTSALQAAQLGLTTSKQLDSVANTLKDSFAKAFKELAPSVNVVADKLKEVFGSEKFINSITNVAAAIGNLTVFLVENYKAIGYIIEAFLVYKAVTLGAGFFEMLTRGLTGVAAAFGAVTVATNGAAVATGLLGRALSFLPGLGIILAGVTAAWALYNIHAGTAKNNAISMAENYNKDFLKALEEEAKRLEKTNEVMAKGTKLKDADAVATRELAMAKLKENNQEALRAALKDVDKASQSIKPGAAKEAIAQLNKVKKDINETEEKALRLTDRIVNASKIKKDAYEAEGKAADEVAKKAAGTKTFGSQKGDTAAINDDYAASITKLNNQVKAAKKDMQNYEDKLNDAYKAGEKGKLQVIRDSAANQIEEYEKIGKAIDTQIAIASKGKNKNADMERFSGLRDANIEALEQSKRKQAQETNVYLAQLAQDNTREQVKQLEAQGKFVDAAALRWSTDFSPALKAVKADFEMFGDTVPEIGERLRQLGAIQKEMMHSAAVKEAVAAYDTLALSIGNIIKGVQTAYEGQGLAAMFEAALNATEKYKAALPDLQEKLKKLKELSMAPDASAGDKKAYEEALKQQKALAENYKTTWAGVSQSISKSLEGAFGKSGKAAGQMLTAITKYHNEDNKSLGAKTKLYGDLAGSAQGFFKEGSSGYKILGTVSKAFYLAETAMAIASIAPKIAAGAATMFAQGGFAGFAGVAAMIAVMAGLGFAGSSTSGGPTVSAEDRQKAAGTGSVLGDSNAKSESIAKSLEHIEKNSGMNLVHSAQMVKSLHTIASSITGLSSLISRTTGITAKGGIAGVEEGTTRQGIGNPAFGGPLAMVVSKIPAVGAIITKLFGKTVSVIDQGITAAAKSLKEVQEFGIEAMAFTDIQTKKKFLGVTTSKKNSTQTNELPQEISDQFTLVISSIADSITFAAETLGLGGSEFTKKLESFVVDLGKISFKDLTGEQIQEQLENIFSKLGDDMAKFGVEGLTNFQKVGEGYFETLTRVVSELVQVQDVFAVLGKSFNATGIGAVQLSQDLIKVFGSIEKLTEGTAFFVENFLTDSERLAPIQASLEKEMTRLGHSSVDTIEEFKKLVLAQDLNTLAGQQMYAALINVAPAFKAVEEAATKAAEKQKEITSKQRELDIQLMEAQGNGTGALAARRADELEALTKLSPALAETQKQIWALTDASSALKNAANSDFSILQKSVQAQKDASQAAYDAQMVIISAQRTSAKEAYDKALESAKARNDKLKDLSAALKSTLDSMLDNTEFSLKRSEAQAILSKTLSVAKTTGVLPTADAMKDVLSAISKSDTSLFRSYEDYATDLGVTAGQVAELNKITEKQKSVSDLQLEALTKSYELQVKSFDIAEKAAKEKLERDNRQFEAIIKYAQLQLDAMNGTQIAVKSLGEALRSFNSSVQASLTAQQSAGQVAAPGVAPGLGQIAAPQQTTTDQIKDLYDKLLGRTPDAGGLAYWQDKAKNGMSASQIAQFIMQGSEYQQIHGSHAGGLDEVPFDGYTARLHKGESVSTAAETKRMRNDATLADIVMAIENLHKDNSAENQAMNSNLTTVRKRIVDVTQNGTSLTVDIVTV